MKVITDIKNKLMKRREVSFLVHETKNPGFAIAGKVAEHFKADAGLVVVKNVKSGFGKSEFLVDAFIYDNAEAKAIEPKPKVKKAEGAK